MQNVCARVDDERFFALYSGRCGAFYVQPGKVRLGASIDAWSAICALPNQEIPLSTA